MSDDNVIPLKPTADSPVAKKAEADAAINDMFGGIFRKSSQDGQVPPAVETALNCATAAIKGFADPIGESLKAIAANEGEMLRLHGRLADKLEEFVRLLGSIEERIDDIDGKLGEIKDIERRLDNIEWRLNRRGGAA